MTRFLLVRPGTTDFDEQGRMKGTLDIPLSACGQEQVNQLAQELASETVDIVFYAPGECAKQTAIALATSRKLQPKVVNDLRNIDHGLWHGKLIEEVRQSQPKVYRQWQEHPESACPPQGESVASAVQRVAKVIDRLSWKLRGKTIALVTLEPLYSLVRSAVEGTPVGDLWKTSCAPAGWQMVQQSELAPRIRRA